MAHLGKFFPIEQLWRCYAADVETLAGFPPAIAQFRTTHWVSTVGTPAVNTWFDCEPWDWSAGDTEIFYRSDVILSGAHDIRVGAKMKLIGRGFPVWTYAVWDNDVDQIPWGWRDTADHFAWFPGNVEIVPTLPAAGGSIYPVGSVEIRGKPWP